MSIETLSLREIEKQTKDMYEAAVVIARRARQIIADRVVETDFDETAEEIGLMDEPDEEYVELEKATTQALHEFLNGEIEWGYPVLDEEGEVKEE